MLKQLLTYFALAFLISWIIWFPLYGHIFGFNNLPVIPFNHAAGALGPLTASFITTYIFLRRDGLKSMLKQCIQIKPVAYLLIAFFSPFVLAMLAILISSLLNDAPLNLAGLLTSKEFPQFNIIVVFIYNLIFFGFGEEVGWRGFALPRLQNKFSALKSVVILTLFWALWHLPLFFYRPGYVSMEIAGIAGWGFSLLTGSILLTWLYNSSRASILVCAVFHSTVDIVFTANLGSENSVSYLGVLITVWGVITVLIFKPKTLSVTALNTGSV